MSRSQCSRVSTAAIVWYTCIHVIHVHIKSARPGDDGTYATCYPDEDPIQARILADLKARDYDGWVSIEPHLHAQIQN